MKANVNSQSSLLFYRCFYTVYGTCLSQLLNCVCVCVQSLAYIRQLLSDGITLSESTVLAETHHTSLSTARQTTVPCQAVFSR